MTSSLLHAFAVWAMRKQLAATAGAAATMPVQGAHLTSVPQCDANPTGTSMQVPAAAAAVPTCLHAWQVCSAVTPGRHAGSNIRHYQLGRSAAQQDLQQSLPAALAGMQLPLPPVDMQNALGRHAAR